MSRYAENTTVSSDKSKHEIENTLARYGAEGFMHGWSDKDGIRVETLAFFAYDRQVRFMLPMPSKDDPQFWKTPEKKIKRIPAKALECWEQACRQRWRALALVIKAKLEAVEAKITTFEEEFLAHILLPDQQSVGDFMRPQIAVAYENGKMPMQLTYVIEDGKK